ncbi:MAG: methyltransferase domain-containing protein [Acetobacteraceae bacterium]
MTETPAIDWDAKYRAGSAPWERAGPHPAFLEWRAAGVLTPCRILIPGAGRSPEPLALAEAGFDVTLLDTAPSAVAAQQARFARLGVRAHAVAADLFTWVPDAAFDAPAFDAVYDQACLCALPPGLWPDYAARLAAWLRPGGGLFVLFMQTGQPGGPPFDCGLAAMRRLFDPARWGWPDTLPPAVPHPSLRGEEQPVVLRRR